MPLRDHFRPPIDAPVPWSSLFSGWISTLTERLNDVLPPEYVALDSLRLDGEPEIDIAEGVGVIADTHAATGTVPFAIPDEAAIRVFAGRESRKLVGAIELVSPGNKDRDVKRELFLGKCLDHLGSGVCLVIVDVVTDRRANLHNELMRHLECPATLELPEVANLYTATYRPVQRGKRTELDVWTLPLAVGSPLPTMPLRLVADTFVPVELEFTYTEACRRRRLV